MTTEQEAFDAAEKVWQFERKVSLPALITILVMLFGGAAAFWKVQAQATDNAEAIDKMETVPADIIRIQEQLAQMRAQQEALTRDVDQARRESSAADAMQLEALQNIALAIARLEERLNRSQ